MKYEFICLLQVENDVTFIKAVLILETSENCYLPEHLC